MMNLKTLIASLYLFISVSPTMAKESAGHTHSPFPSDSIFTINQSQQTFVAFEQPSAFFEEGLLQPTTNNDSIQSYIDFASTILNEVRKKQNFISRIDEQSKFELPVGIVKKVGNIEYELAIHAIRLKPAFAELDVVLQFTVPQNNQVLTFKANGIKFSNKGGIIGDAKLELVGDYAINLNGNKSQIILKGSGSNGGTFATIDCDGFKQLGLDADVKFSRDLIRPENPDGSIAEGNVVTSFTTVLTNWNDLVVQLSLPSFQVTGLNGVGFEVQDAVFDFSDTRNAPATKFPQGYGESQMLPGNANLWRGFYLRSLTVKLPPEFKQKGNPQRTTFQASDVLIDNLGFTGTLKATNLLSLEKGDMNGWAFSLDSLQISLQANELTEAGFVGNIVIPVSDEKTPFEYSALIQPGGNYLFNVSPAKDLKFNLWKANVEIYESSYLDIRIVDNKFLPKANLHGRMNIKGSLSEGGQGVELANVAFENLELQSVKPYIKVGSFSFGSEAAQQKMAGFPISIQDIGLKNISDTQVGLDFKLKLNLVGEESGSFAADAGLTLVGVMNSEQGWQSWKYKDIAVRDIGVDIDGGAFKMKGQLTFYKNDISYGDGFNGTVKAEFTPGIKVSASAIFGNVTGMRYWYADAMANFGSGVPVFTGVAIYGFGGGAYYRMKMDVNGQGSALGKTASGTVYVPDAKSGLGLKAVVSIGSHPKPEAFNGDVTFEILFFQGGGVRSISFGGNGYLVTPGLDFNMDKLQKSTNKMVGTVKKLEGQLADGTKGLVTSGSSENTFKEIFGEIGDKAGSKGQISARVFIQYDFENRILHGNFEAFINVAGGLIKGVGPGGRAGFAVLHFAPKEWYVYVGTPDDRIGISVGIGPIRASAASYFMVGTKILGSPPPPENVSRILGGVDLDYMRDLNALGTGAGFAFGAALQISTGDLTFLMFYARFDAGAGFDIMLKDYGDTHCKGRSGRLGVNGWYANGQAYAYFEGKIGIQVRVFGKRRKAEILKIGAAAVLQAKLPNPFWMRGIVGGYFSVFGGLVKGQCKFQVTLGEECEIIQGGSPVEDIKVIAELTPADNEKNVNVFNNAQVVFNMPVEKEFELLDANDDKRYFRVKLDHFKLISDGKELQGTFEWNDANDVVAFQPYEVLPSEKQIRLSAQIYFEERKGGSWQKVVDEGRVITEKMESVFTSGKAPNFIPHDNIEYAYPVIGQLNYFKGETSEGYIKLKKGQSYLFSPGAEWKQTGRFTASSGEKTQFDFTYSDLLVKFTVPTTTLKNNQVYALQLVNIPTQSNGSIDRNVKTLTNQVKTDGVSTDIEVTTRDAEGSIETLEETPIFTSYLKTSLFNTVSEKVNSLRIGNTFSVIVVPWHVHQLKSFLTGNEYFDQVEIKGNTFTKEIPILQMEAQLEDNSYYQDFAYPLIYKNYPVNGIISIQHRTTSVLGIPPSKAVYIAQEPDNYKLRDEDYFNNSQVNLIPSTAYYNFDMPFVMDKDYRDIKAQAINKYIFDPVLPASVQSLLLGSFPMVRAGVYQYKLRHVLPGINKVTSEKAITVSYK